MGIFQLFRHLSESADRMDRMMRRLGIKGRFKELPDGGAVLRRATMRCSNCEEPGACENWLSEHSSASHAPRYCRNHDLFERLMDQVKAEHKAA